MSEKCENPKRIESVGYESCQKIPISSTEQVLPERHLLFEADLPKRLGQHDMVWQEPSGLPAVSKEGAPIGNGDFGALIYGYPDNLCFALGKTDIWDRSGLGRSNFPTGTFQDFRQTYFDKDEAKFHEFCNSVDDTAHKQHATTAGILRLHIHEANVALSRILHVSLFQGISYLKFTTCIGVVKTAAQYESTCVESFVSRAYKVLAIRIKGSKCPVTWELSRAEHKPHPIAEAGADEQVSWLEQNFTTGDKYVLAQLATGVDAEDFVCGNRVVGQFLSEGTEDIIIYLTIVSNRDSQQPLEEARIRLARAKATGYEQIRKEHETWWTDYWKKAYVCVQDEGIEKWWYRSLYLAGSTIQPGCQSPGLQGVWVRENIPPWWGDYHSNYNLQSNYSGMFTSNRVEFLEPFVRFLLSIVPQCRKDTREYFQMRGINFPLASSIDGYSLIHCSWSNLGVSIGGSSWLTHLCWQVYKYTGDKKYLREIVYPLLKEVSLFYEDYLIWDKQANRWVVEPSLFWEALCPGFASWGKNSLYELSLVYGAFQRVLAAAKELEVDESMQAKWADILAKLSDLPSDPDNGGWIGFEGRDVRKFGSHQFDMPPVFPEELVSIYHGPEKWRKQALATLDNPLTWEGEAVQTGTSMAGGHGIREIIRLGWVDKAVEAARWGDHTKTNGLNYKWIPDYVQIEHGLGMSGVLSDMLLHCLGGVVRVFPCFPKNIPAAFHSLRVPGAFMVSAEKRKEEIDYILIQSLAGNDLHIANPWKDQTRVRDLISGEVLTVADAHQLKIPTVPGQLLVFDRIKRPYEKINKIIF